MEIYYHMEAVLKLLKLSFVKLHSSQVSFVISLFLEISLLDYELTAAFDV